MLIDVFGNDDDRVKTDLLFVKIDHSQHKVLYAAELALLSKEITYSVHP